MSKRNIFIGDIHGCYDEFKLLIDKLKIKDSDSVFLVWDMINKWPKSWKVIKFLYENRDQYKAVLWNHELAFFQRISNKDKKYKSEIFCELEKKFNKNPEIFQYFKDLPLYIKSENFIVIHWWLNPNKKLEEHSESEITWIREINSKPWFTLYNDKLIVIYGHWAMNGLNIYKNTIWLDWGCVYWRALHAYILESGEIVTQQALKLYKDVFIKED